MNVLSLMILSISILSILSPNDILNIDRPIRINNVVERKDMKSNTKNKGIYHVYVEVVESWV